MSDIEKRIAKLNQRFRQLTNDNPPVGILGTATGEITDRSTPGNVWAREWSSGQYGTPKSYPNALPDGTRIRAGMAIELGWKNGVQSVTDKDRLGIINAGGNPAPPINPYTDPRSITPFLVLPVPGALHIKIIGHKWVDGGTTTITVPTTDDAGDIPDVDLTSVEAGLSTGEQCYAVVYLLADFSGYEVTSSTAISTLLPLGDSYMDECHALKTMGSFSIWALVVQEGQSEFSNTDIYTEPAFDLRWFFAPRL